MNKYFSGVERRKLCEDLHKEEARANAQQGLASEGGRFLGSDRAHCTGLLTPAICGAGKS